MRLHFIPAALALALVACGGGSASTPAAPVAVASPTPAPTPTPDPYVALYGCPLPPLPDLHNQCPKETPRLADYVTNAIDKTIRDHPGYFRVDSGPGGDVYYVLDRSRYIKSVVEDVRAQGVCAIEQVEEVAVKNTNAFNEQYNVWASSGYVRRPPGAYITTCYPAQF